MPIFDELVSDEERNEWAVREHLRAQAILAQGEAELAARARANTERMLAEVVPRRPICCYARIEKGRRSMWAALDAEEPKKHFVCNAPGERMIAITGDWFCAEHDPLRFPPPVRTCMP